MDKPHGQQRFDRGFTWAVGLFTAALVLLVFLQSAVFSLQIVELKGQVLLTEADVMEIAGISYGESIFNIDVRQVRERLAHHAQIAAATVRRRLPATLVIEIAEREPVALAPHAEGFAALDAEGRILFVTPELRLPLPLLTGLAGRSALQAAPGETVNAAYAPALAVAAALPPDLVARVSEVRWAEAGIDLLMRDGVTVLLGDTTQLDLKLQTLRAVLSSLVREPRTVTQIDLRVPRTPVLR